nr:hypothetical protein CFP56_13024 [Quercus suber]
MTRRTPTPRTPMLSFEYKTLRPSGSDARRRGSDRAPHLGPPGSRHLHRITVALLPGTPQRHPAIFADEPALELGDELGAAAGIVEEAVAAADVLLVDLLGAALLREQVGGGDQVAGVAQPGLLAELGEQGEGVGRHVDLLLLGADGEDLADLVGRVGVGGDDDDAVEEVERQAVRRAVAGPADRRAAPVARHDDDRRQLVLERAVDEAEALDVQHVHLVDEQHPRHDLRLAFLPPLGHLGVDLLAHLAADLARVAGEQGQKALGAAVDDVDLVERHGVHRLPSHLQLAVRALDELRVRAHGVVVTAAGVASAQLGDAPARLVDRDDVARHDFLLGHAIDHARPHVVQGLHVGRLERELPALVVPRHRPVDLDLHHLALDDLAFLAYPHPDALSERLFQRLRLAHLQAEDLRGRQHREGHIIAKPFAHADRDRRLARAGRARDEHRPSRDLTLLDHLQNHARRFARFRLSHQAVSHRLRHQRVGRHAQAADVRVRCDQVQSLSFLGVGDGGDGLRDRG